MPTRAAGVCGLLAFLTFNIAWIAGGLAQPDAFSSADDDISDLGAMTADAAWIYNQIGANLTGLLIIALGLGLWRVLSPSTLGRAGAAAVVVTGTAAFAGGVFRLDCQGIDSGCENDSWHASAHKVASGVLAGATFIAPLALAVAFRRIPEWRESWRPTLAVIPALFAANLLFSSWATEPPYVQGRWSSSGSRSSVPASSRRASGGHAAPSTTRHRRSSMAMTTFDRVSLYLEP